MTLLLRHVTVTVTTAMLLVMVVLLGLNFLGVLTEQFDDIRGHYTFWEVIKYGLWRMPGYAAESISFVAMIGCLVGLGVLANHNELTVMRASGVSLTRIAGMVMLPMTLLIVIGLGLEEVAAYADRQAEKSRTVALASEAPPKNRASYRKGRLRPEESVLQEKGVWNRQGNEFVRFDKVLPDGRVYGVTRIAFDEGRQLLSMQNARRGVYEDNGWRLEDVTNRYFVEDHLAGDSIQYLRWGSALTLERLLFVSEEPENLAVGELTDYSAFLQEQGRDNRAYELEYWRRVLQPAVLFSLVLIAMSFVFGSLRQVGVAQRVFVGVIIGVGFHILQDIFGTSSLVFGFSPLAGVLVPVLACAVTGLVLLYRVR